MTPVRRAASARQDVNPLLVSASGRSTNCRCVHRRVMNRNAPGNPGRAGGMVRERDAGSLPAHKPATCLAPSHGLSAGWTREVGSRTACRTPLAPISAPANQPRCGPGAGAARAPTVDENERGVVGLQCLVASHAPRGDCRRRSRCPRAPDADVLDATRCIDAVAVARPHVGRTIVGVPAAEDPVRGRCEVRAVGARILRVRARVPVERPFKHVARQVRLAPLAITFRRLAPDAVDGSGRWVHAVGARVVVRVRAVDAEECRRARPRIRPLLVPSRRRVLRGAPVDGHQGSLIDGPHRGDGRSSRRR